MPRAHVRTSRAEQERFQRSLLKKSQKEFRREWIRTHTFVDYELAETVSQTTDRELHNALRDKFKDKPILVHVPEILRAEIFADSRGRGSHQIYGGENGL